MNTPEDQIVDREVQNFPCRCEHCRWQDKVRDAKMADGKVQCPTCDGQLSSDTLADRVLRQISDAHEYGFGGGSIFG